MNSWTKLMTFDNLFEAELKKSLLKQAGVEAVIINARDSMFLIGDIELYVKEQDKAKAENILLQFQGLTKINSFILEKPVRLFAEFLKSKGIETILKRKEETEFVLDNYELYVKNEDLDKVLPYLKTDELDNWVVIERCHRVRQTRFRTELLEENNIEAMVVKKKDDNFILEEIKIFVDKNQADKGREILNTLPGMKKLTSYDKLHRAEIREDLLGQHGIKAIIKKNNSNFDLFVYEKDLDEANEILKAKREFVKIKTYDSLINAQSDLEKLLAENINASIVSKKDDVFLLGEYYLYVDEEQTEKAINILK